MYKVQTGAFLIKRNAENYVKQLKAKGFDCFIKRQGIYYKVQCGAFNSKQNAQNLKAELQKQGFDAIIVEENKEVAFTPRLTKNGMLNSQYWYSDGNPFYPVNQLPNCTCYCYGRWWEIMQVNPTNLPRGNGGTWYDTARNNGLSVGSTPALGAIACWYDPTGYRLGHVAVVEQITANGDIITSNSGYERPVDYDSSLYFWTETCYRSNGYRSSWEANWGYQLKGFIYLSNAPVSKAWIYGNRYLDTTEMRNNAEIVFDYFYASGYSYNAICAILGNMQRESGVNPGIWENLTVDISRGFGLVQWTPSTKYTDWANANGYPIDDGTYQLQWINTVLDADGHWIQRQGYNITWEQFKASNQSVAYLTGAFYWNFENPNDGSLELRQVYAEEWNQYFQNYTPSDPINPPIGQRGRGLKIWEMIRYRRR